MQAWLRRIAANILWVAMLAAAPTGTQAQRALDVDTLNQQVVQLFDQGKYKEAFALAEKALALAERVLGEEHPDTR